MTRQNLRTVISAVLALVVIVSTSLYISRGEARAAGTVHSVTPASKANYSTAVEQPVWSLSCDSASGRWTFTINEVQIIDASKHTWNDSEGPWHLTIFATTPPGPVPFSTIVTLHQNGTNGLYTVSKSATSTDAATWCQTGASITVTAFSGSDQPLLLDGTLN
jgi:hypothetical protein